MQPLQNHFYLALAVTEAEKFAGATAPNPPVGACLVSADAQVLTLGAHERAGSEHAEAQALRRALELFGADSVRGSTLYVTLEPCNHQGRTPACTEAILKAGVARVVYGARDLNKKVLGGGADRLQAAGIEVEIAEKELCQSLIQPFSKWITTGRPWVVHKLAWRLEKASAGSMAPTMVPQPGTKTFTSEDSLRLAHLERRKSDAILTGIGTVLADEPLFTVRRLTDHADKRRLLAVLSAKARALPPAWVARQNELGFDVISFKTIEDALNGLGKLGAQRLLVEAGPSLSESLAESRLWDERLSILSLGPDQPDRVYRIYNKGEN